jgi:hypothetical protein
LTDGSVAKPGGLGPRQRCQTEAITAGVSQGHVRWGR